MLRLTFFTAQIDRFTFKVKQKHSRIYSLLTFYSQNCIIFYLIYFFFYYFLLYFGVIALNTPFRIAQLNNKNMFTQKYQKQILAFLPFVDQNELEKSVHQSKQYQENYNYHEYSSSEQCFTPNYNQVEEQQPTYVVNIVQKNDHQEKQIEKNAEKISKQNQFLNKGRDQQKDEEQSDKNQSRIDYSLYQRLRGGNAIQYANLIYINEKSHSQQNFAQEYRDSGISFLENQLILPHQQNQQNRITAVHVQPHNVNKTNQPFKFSTDAPLQSIYQSFYIQGEPKSEIVQQDILFKWELIVQFLRWEYLENSNGKNNQNQNAKMTKINQIQTYQNYRGSWPGKNLQYFDKSNKKLNKLLSPESDINKIPIEIVRSIQKLEQKIQPFNLTESSYKKMLQKQIYSIFQKLSKKQQLNIKRLQKQDNLIQRYKEFLLKIKLDYENKQKISLKQSQVVIGKRIQRVSTQLIRTKRIIKKQVLRVYDEFSIQIKQLKKQIETQVKKHKQQLDEIQYVFQNEIINSYQSLKEVQKQIREKQHLLQEKIQNVKQRLNKSLNSQISQNEEMTSNIKGLMIQLISQIQQLP